MIFFKGYSLMVKQRSSKSYLWVQFLLSLIYFNKIIPFRNKINEKLIFNNKKILLINEDKKKNKDLFFKKYFFLNKFKINYFFF